MHHCDLHMDHREAYSGVRAQNNNGLVIIVTPIEHEDKDFYCNFGPAGYEAKRKPGVQCPTCARLGNIVYITPGRNCYVCGTPCE